MSKGLEEVINLAASELRSCYTNKGIIGGTHHFTDYWARDGYFASLGSLTIGDNEIVETMLQTFYNYQRRDGLIPYRIMRGPVTPFKYMGKPAFYKSPRPDYKLRGVGSEIFDGTTLTLLLTAKLGLNKWAKAKNYITQIKKALLYLSSHEKNGLLLDGILTEWNDTALKCGNLLYSNVIYYHMYSLLSEWTKVFDATWHSELKLKKDSVYNAIHNKLWNNKYFADWYDYKRQDYFYSFGNCLAIVWNLANKKESELILKQCEKVKIRFTLETNSPKYPWWRIDPLLRLIGMGDYQNKTLLWWQPITAYIAALKKAKKVKEANKAINLIIRKISSDRSIYECYERTGKPVKRLFYSSENPFAWGSGMLLWALINPV